MAITENATVDLRICMLSYGDLLLLLDVSY